MFASLGEVTTRVTVAKDLLLRALEDQPGAFIALRVADHAVDVVSVDDELPTTLLPAPPRRGGPCGSGSGRPRSIPP
ncbi:MULTISPECIES: hypothetical protein [unclassified Streptomyces]|uniref:hypothetical protein n=1 Tax=unclassified Streptomyces TaxID=2593676 RepID=UPI0036FF01B7